MRLAFAVLALAVALVLLLLLAGGPPVAVAPPPTPPPPPPAPPPVVLPDYAPTERVTGRIRSVGSDTMNNLLTLWAEGVLRAHPAIEIDIQGKGSVTAPVALIAGTSELGPMSREMRPKEIEYFVKKFGHPPTALATSIDMLAVFVHRDNPIKGLTLAQVDAIFSRERKGGHPTDIATWGELGLSGEWADRPISLYGRNPASGTYGYFKMEALRHGTYKDALTELPGSSSVVGAVAKDRFGIGYSGIGYRTAAVRAVPLTGKAGEPFVDAALLNACSGAYPLSRYLLLYVNVPPGGQPEPPVREFLKYVFSRQGQADVARAGYFPLPASLAREQLAKAGIR